MARIAVDDFFIWKSLIASPYLVKSLLNIPVISFFYIRNTCAEIDRDKHPPKS